MWYKFFLRLLITKIDLKDQAEAHIFVKGLNNYIQNLLCGFNATSLFNSIQKRLDRKEPITLALDRLINKTDFISKELVNAAIERIRPVSKRIPTFRLKDWPKHIEELSEYAKSLQLPSYSCYLPLEMRLLVICKLFTRFEKTKKLTLSQFLDDFFFFSLLFFKQSADVSTYNSDFYAFFSGHVKDLAFTTLISLKERRTFAALGYSTEIDSDFLLKMILRMILSQESAFELMNDLLHDFSNSNTNNPSIKLPLQEQLEFINDVLIFYQRVGRNDFIGNALVIFITYLRQAPILSAADMKRLLHRHLIGLILYQTLANNNINFINDRLELFRYEPVISCTVTELEYLKDFSALHTAIAANPGSQNLCAELQKAFINYQTNYIQNLKDNFIVPQQSTPLNDMILSNYFTGILNYPDTGLAILIKECQQAIFTWILQQADREKAVVFLFDLNNYLAGNNKLILDILYFLVTLRQLLEMRRFKITQQGKESLADIINDECDHYLTNIQQGMAVKDSEKLFLFHCMYRIVKGIEPISFNKLLPYLLNKGQTLNQFIQQIAFFLNLQELVKSWRPLALIPQQSCATVFTPVITTQITNYFLQKEPMDFHTFIHTLSRALLQALSTIQDCSQALLIVNLQHSLQVLPNNPFLLLFIEDLNSFAVVFDFLHKITAFSFNSLNGKIWYDTLQAALYKMIKDYCDNHYEDAQFFVKRCDYYFTNALLEKAQLLHTLTKLIRDNRDKIKNPLFDCLSERVDHLMDRSNFMLESLPSTARVGMFSNPIQYLGERLKQRKEEDSQDHRCDKQWYKKIALEYMRREEEAERRASSSSLMLHVPPSPMQKM